MIRVGIVGARGLSVVGAMKAMPERVKIAAMCDLDEGALAEAKAFIEKDNENADGLKLFRIYDDMIEHGDIDAVIISTPMQCHVPQAITALQAGKHVMCEVTAAVTMDELWWLIENVEKSGKIYMYAENYCYMPECQIVRAMVKKGMFGEIYYGEGEYTHDCTSLRNWHGKTGWRSYWQMGTRGSFYPTHSLGPVMQCFDDDRIAAIASFSPGNHNPYGLRNDDLTQTMCVLESGKLVKLRVDTISPRPHAMAYYQIQGTKGCYEANRFGGEGKIAVATDADPTGYAQWKDLSAFKEFLPERYRSGAGEGAGHGGGDYYIVEDFIEAIEKNVQPELNVYKAAEWTSVALLSQLSVTNQGKLLEVPKFRPNMSWAEKRIKL
ncbi:MAG: Gfo/Idh/MocA family oxidoreductase [Clostridia bacterium]|nr:Gfo/Idh/MocA family oxidoreductase [Clostridia bacterium]MBR0157902.1 Gfo/Idh/MocA family oxidoreductase [Clostridia bacterium]MBR7061484.1 Gfo/Idh/MocA family oxidoreductase [Clostridia bacterium]